MVKVNNITFAYERDGENVLEEVGFSIVSGECIAILGNNGAGKSTLLKCINRICPTKDGVVMVEGKNVYTLSPQIRAQQLAYVPQNSESSSMTVFDAVLLGRKPYITWDASQQDRKITSQIIQQMGLSGFAMRKLNQLSGGEAQKVLLARALAQDPKFLLLDEPTSNLDPYNQHEVLRTVRKIASQHKIAVAVIMHDLNLALRYCDKFLFLKDAEVFAYGTVEIVNPETIREVYNIDVDIIEHKGNRVIVPL